MFQQFNQSFLHKITVYHHAHFPHRCRLFEVADQLHLLTGKVQRGQFGQYGDAVILFHQATEGFNAARFIIKMTAFGAGLPQFTEVDDLRPETMSFLQQPQMIGIDILCQHVGLLKGLVLF